MRKHIIFIASIHILLGAGLGVLFLNGHYHFFSISDKLPAENSLADNSSFFEKTSNFYDVYMNFFAQFGINPLFSLFIIVISISFGYGLLKS